MEQGLRPQDREEASVDKGSQLDTVCLVGVWASRWNRRPWKQPQGATRESTTRQRWALSYAPHEVKPWRMKEFVWLF